jgi:thiamine pyrophosphate-dependent acetolactate synthase large subunit-like protein
MAEAGCAAQSTVRSEVSAVARRHRKGGRHDRQGEVPGHLRRKCRPSQDAFEALIELAELAAIPVLEGQGAFFGNFPKSHDLYLGAKIEPLYGEMDLALLVESRVPWYPPSNAPQDAEIVAISECPLKGHMVYQTMHAEHYLDGDVAVTLRLLSEALRTIGVDRAKVSERRAAGQPSTRSGLRACAPPRRRRPVCRRSPCRS